MRVSFSSFLSAFHFLKNNARETLSEEIKEDGKESVRVRACVCVKEREREIASPRESESERTRNIF